MHQGGIMEQNVYDTLNNLIKLAVLLVGLLATMKKTQRKNNRKRKPHSDKQNGPKVA